MERLTRAQLDDYCHNAGLTKLQKQILKARYFDEEEENVVAVCIKLSISESKFYRVQRRLLDQIYRYESRKK